MSLFRRSDRQLARRPPGDDTYIKIIACTAFNREGYWRGRGFDFTFSPADLAKCLRAVQQRAVNEHMVDALVRVFGQIEEPWRDAVNAEQSMATLPM